MEYQQAIQSYVPVNEQERGDREVILEYIHTFPANILTRENRFAHITSSGFIMDPGLGSVLMVHHNIYNTWAWTGGHADGDPDLLAVALREAQEETGVTAISPLCDDILSLDILPVWGHVKKGKYVSCHLHLSVAYVLIAEKSAALQVCPGENTGVAWIAVEEIPQYSNEPDIITVYNKLINRARSLRQ